MLKAFTTGAATALVLALAIPAAHSETLKFKAKLDAASEVPANDGAGTGKASLKYDTDTKDLKYTLSYKGLTGDATAAPFPWPRRSGRQWRRRGSDYDRQIPDQGRGHIDRCSGRRSVGREMVCQRPHRSPSGWRDSRTGDTGHEEEKIRLSIQIGGGLSPGRSRFPSIGILPFQLYETHTGWVAERLKAAVLKTAVGASSPWVRIPPHPPFQSLSGHAGYAAIRHERLEQPGL